MYKYKKIILKPFSKDCKSYLVISPTKEEMKELYEKFKTAEKVKEYLCNQDPNPCGRENCSKLHK